MGFFSKIKNAIMASTATKAAAAVVMVAVLGGTVAGLVYGGVFTGAEAAVITAAMNTFNGQTETGEEIFGLRELSAALQEQGAELGVEVTLPELPMEELGLSGMTLPNAGFQLTARVTPQDTVSTTLDIKVANTTLLTGNAYLDRNQLQVSVPKLSGSVLALNYSDAAIEEQINASYAAKYLGLTKEQTEQIVDHLPKQTEPVSTEEIQQKLMEIVVEAYRDNLADKGITKFEKAGKEELHDNNLVQKCKVYTATMDARYFMEFIYEVTLRTKVYCKELCAAQGIEESMAEEWFHPVDTAVHQLKLGMQDTITWTFYACEDRLVRICGNWTIDWVDEVGSCTRPGALELVLAPEGNPLENMRFYLDTPVHYDDSITSVPQSIELKYQVVTENTEDSYCVKYNAEYNEEPLDFEFDYEKLAGDFVLKVADHARSLTLTGAIGELEKGRKIGLELDAYKYIEGDYTEEQELAVSLSVKTLDKEVTPLTGTQQDVLQMTEADFAALEKEISTNITWMLFGMMGLFQ